MRSLFVAALFLPRGSQATDNVTLRWQNDPYLSIVHLAPQEQELEVVGQELGAPLLGLHQRGLGGVGDPADRRAELGQRRGDELRRFRRMALPVQVGLRSRNGGDRHAPQKMARPELNLERRGTAATRSAREGDRRASLFVVRCLLVGGDSAHQCPLDS
jgi:hypothetical protein